MKGANYLSFRLADQEGIDTFISWNWNCMQWVLFDSVINSGKISPKLAALIVMSKI